MNQITLHEIVAFDNYEIRKMEPGLAEVSTVVSPKSLNYYGHAHGGYLFTLCDQISGLSVFMTGFDVVTIQSSINYLKGAQEGETLIISGRIVHDGRSTKVVETIITNDEQELVAKGTFTMFVTGKHESKQEENH